MGGREWDVGGKAQRDVMLDPMRRSHVDGGFSVDATTLPPPLVRGVARW